MTEICAFKKTMFKTSMDYKLYNLKLNCLFVTFILLLTNHNDKLKRQYYQLSRNENQIT